MRRVKFDLVLDENKIVYPDGPAFFREVEIVGGTVYALYSGAKDLDSDDRIQELAVDIQIDKSSVMVGEQVNYTATFNALITITDPVPLSVIDRNNQHVKNIGITITDGVATGSISFDRSGDFSITERSINYHKNVIPSHITLNNPVLIRVYE